MLHAPSATDPSTKQRKPRKPRGRGLRTTTGCTICRRRHMKCDEVKPVCGPCAKGTRPCTYGAPKSGSATSEGEPASANSVGSGYPLSEPLRRASDSQLPVPRYDTVTRVQAPWVVPQPSSTRLPLDRARPPIVQNTNNNGELASSISWTSSYDTPHALTSPQSTFSFNSEVAPQRWFGLLVDDADILQSDAFLDRTPEIPVITGIPYPTSALPLSSTQLALTPAHIQVTTLRPPNPTIDEKLLWQAPMSLLDHEIPLFRKFVNELSGWLDLFDPLKHFESIVPQLALHNEGVMKAILALAARHTSIKPSPTDSAPINRTAAAQYYEETLQYLQRAMRYESYRKSQEILVTALIVSTYEMVDGSGKSWERHLKGVYWIQGSQNSNGESTGLRQAVWWAWTRQDIWAAFREKRRCFNEWRPKKTYDTMDPFEIASRAVYLLAECVNYASEEEKQAGDVNLTQRINRADAITLLLDEWEMNLTVHFKPLPTQSAAPDSPRAIWINPPAFSAAVQMHNLSRILLLMLRPVPGGYAEYFTWNQAVTDALDTIIGIAHTVTDQAAAIVSTQCLYGAALYCQDLLKRETILALLDNTQRKTGWPVTSLADEVRAPSGPQKL